MMKSICTSSLLLLSTSLFSTGFASQESQVHLTASSKHHQVDPAILAALEKYSDPVDAFVSLHPEAAEQLAEPRLLHVLGEPDAQWLTEGDKLRLKRKGKKFTDITDHESFYKEQVHTLAGKARKLECHIHDFVGSAAVTKISRRPAQAYSPAPGEVLAASCLYG